MHTLPRIEDIASEARVAVPTVYKVFANKRNLLRASVEAAIRGVEAGEVERQSVGSPPRKPLPTSSGVAARVFGLRRTAHVKFRELRKVKVLLPRIRCRRSSQNLPSRTFVRKARCCEDSDTGNDSLVALGKEDMTTVATVVYSA